ncbi:MAG TPA: VWA domain-containing protein [Chloroflexota bacterium]|nr:VWA domain-containing protein [Chloroflexota bacterium]
MILLAPVALALTLIAAPIVAMYILKLRRRDVVVPTTFLWERALQDVQANAPWQRLRPNRLLILQILALLALVFALAQPAFSRTERYSGDLVVIVDESFGMQARDVAPSRFAAAQREAHALARTIGDGNVMSVIGMGTQPFLAIGQSSDLGAIDAAIDRLRVQNGAPNFLGALSLASSLARAGEADRVVVLTSRESGIGPLPLAVNFPVEIRRLGGRLRDLGIVSFSAAGGAETSAILRVQNFGRRTERTDLTLTVDGRLADVRPLTLAPNAQQTLFWNDLPPGARVLQAALDVHDDVTADKNAWSVVPLGSPRRILLITAGDYLLQTALTIDPAARLATVRPSLYRPSLARGYDLLVFDGWLPSSLPSTPSLFVGPPAGRMGSLRWGDEQLPGPLSLAPAGLSGPLAAIGRYVGLGDVHIARARHVTLPGWLQPVISSGGEPLVAAGQSGTTRYALTTFRLQDSDWPLRLSFPVLIQNLVSYLAPGFVLDTADLSAGGVIHLLPPAGSTAIAVRRPDGTTDTLRSPSIPFTDTGEPGLYAARAIGPHPAAATFAVNFFPPRASPASGPSTVWLGGSPSQTDHPTHVPVSLGWVFALLGLGALSAEWWFSFRR